MKISVTHWKEDEWPPPVGSLWQGKATGNVYVCVPSNTSDRVHLLVLINPAKYKPGQPVSINNVSQSAMRLYTRIRRVVIEEK